MRFLGLEMKRILTTKRTWILLAAALVFSGMLAYIPVTFEEVSYADEQGQEISLKGREAVTYLRGQQSKLEGEVTPEKVKQALLAYQECLTKYGAEDTYELPEEADTTMLIPYWELIHGVREAFADENGMAPALTEIPIEETNRYYEKVQERTKALLAMEQPEHRSAQKIGENLYQDVEKPFQYYSGISSNAMDYQVLLIYLITILCVVIASPIFSSDYQTGADDILRCTKHGRGKMAACKIGSAVLICGSTFLICSMVWIAVTNTLFGWESTKTSLQVIFSISSLPNLDIGQTQWLNLAAGFLMFLAMISFALYLSTKMKSMVSSLAAALVFCFLPVFATSVFPGQLGLWLQCLLPGGGIGMGNSFLYMLIDFKFLHLGSQSVWIPYVLVAVTLVQIPVFLGAAVHSHCKMRK